MIKDKIISISKLRTNATKIISSLPETGNKYIFVHGDPKAVLVNVDWFERVNKKYNKYWIEIVEPDDFEKKAIKDYEKKKKEWKLEFVEAFDFLDSLQ